MKNINSNGKNIVANNLNHISFIFLKNMKIKLKNNHHVLFFLKDVIIATKQDFLYCSPYLQTLNEAKHFTQVWMYSMENKKENLITITIFSNCLEINFLCSQGHILFLPRFSKITIISLQN